MKSGSVNPFTDGWIIPTSPSVRWSGVDAALVDLDHAALLQLRDKSGEDWFRADVARIGARRRQALSTIPCCQAHRLGMGRGFGGGSSSCRLVVEHVPSETSAAGPPHAW